jgi:hypothetical protein
MALFTQAYSVAAAANGVVVGPLDEGRYILTGLPAGMLWGVDDTVSASTGVQLPFGTYDLPFALEVFSEGSLEVWAWNTQGATVSGYVLISQLG